MKCLVAGCETDENVVSYTSVFFVNLPSDPVVQEQWFTLLGIADAGLIQAMLNGEAKVCSCHFAEDSFGHHPVYGYRFLLPKALPTVLPLAKYDGEVMDDETVVEQRGPPLDYYFVYLNDTSEPAIIDEATLNEVTGANEFNLIETPDTEDAGKSIAETDDEPVEQIGIDYANGKYYFLKLDNDLLPENDLEPLNNGSVKPTELSYPEQLNTDTEVENEKEKNKENNVDDAEHSFVEEANHFISNSVQNVDQSTHLPIEALPCVQDEVLEEQEPKTTAEKNTSEQDGKDNQSSQEEKVEEYLSSSEAETDNDRNVNVEFDETIQLEYGPIEALDEVSVCGDIVRIRQKNERIDRFFCSECSKGFQYKSALERHSLVHSKEKKFACEECGNRFTQKINLDIHMRLHTGQRPEKKFTCQICGKKCCRMSELETHMTAHLKKFPHVCPICTERYSDLTNFYDHLRADHQNEMRLQEVIDLLSQSENAMVIYEKEPGNIVSEDGRYGCAVCGKSYRQEVMLERHKKKMHVKIFRCPHCPKKFPYKSLLIKHLPSHTLEKPFSCPYCWRSYTQRINLKVHITRKHSSLCPELQFQRPEEDEDDDGQTETSDKKSAARSYSCKQCSKIFPRLSSLIAHLDAHYNDTVPETFDCDLCGISLSARVTLLRHRWRVHGARRSNLNMITNLDLRNVTIVPTDSNHYVEIEDEMDTIFEDYNVED
ncbi:zinc finger protein 567-like [Anopheles nili]|uniref:zinc finger protein 567-like n=1 Tax=Anopheles nili TaxID=185578 RepID=UPI00237B26AC|nr:zinc finger protein 567-like [Anopheles nili]